MIQRLSIARGLQVALLGLAAILAAIAALAMAGLYEARQGYEDELARTYAVEAASARLLAASAVEETVLARRGAGGEEARREARAAFDSEATQLRELAAGDPESERLVERRIQAQRRARELAGDGGAAPPATGPDSLEATLLAAQRLDADLTARQRALRASARDDASSDTRRAAIAAAAAGGLALLAAMALVLGLIAAIRRPLEDLVQATARLARGNLSERVAPRGPSELRELGESFNSMASELDAAHRRLEDERLKLAVTIESLGDGLVVSDAAGRVQSLNPRARELVPELEPGGRATGGSGAGALPAESDALAREVNVDRDGRTLAIAAARLGTEEGGTVWTIRDITERARLERLKSEFVATTSHELRSPLTSIKGFVELLAATSGLTPRQREFVEVIETSTDRLVDLVNDLLDVARIEAGRMEIHPRPTDMGEVARDVARLISPRIEEKGQRLKLDVPARLPRALVDPARMRQVLTNLLTNAHLYTGEGGRISLRLRDDAHSLIAVVSDNGRGMTEDEIEHAFDRFYRGAVSEAGPGTGLGLSIVRSVVELHGGRVDVESELDQGTTFALRLPLEPEPVPVETRREALRGRRVLVVDDEPPIAELIAAQLEPYEVEPVTCSDPEEAIALLRADGFDAITLDILMPRMSGFDVLHAIRSDPALAGTPVVVVSVLSGREALAGEWTVSKPIHAEELADALGSAILAGRTRVLVVARAHLREQLGGDLERLGLDYDWATSGAAAARLCSERRFEVALVDAGMRSPQAALRALNLRGRRLGRAVAVFSTGEEMPGMATLDAEPVPLASAAASVLELLRRPPEGEGGSDGGAA